MELINHNKSNILCLHGIMNEPWCHNFTPETNQQSVECTDCRKIRIYHYEQHGNRNREKYASYARRRTTSGSQQELLYRKETMYETCLHNYTAVSIVSQASLVLLNLNFLELLSHSKPKFLCQLFIQSRVLYAINRMHSMEERNIQIIKIEFPSRAIFKKIDCVIEVMLCFPSFRNSDLQIPCNVRTKFQRNTACVRYIAKKKNNKN